jgi:hypothetical protein
MNVGRTVSWIVSVRFSNGRAVRIKRDEAYLTELQDESAERMKEWLIPDFAARDQNVPVG